MLSEGLRLAEGICGPRTANMLRPFLARSRCRRAAHSKDRNRAIGHSKELAKRFHRDLRRKDSALSVIVLDESGTEIHRERV